jgi:hypothetical protein
LNIVWTFENKDKLKPFLDILNDNAILCYLLDKSKKIDSVDGLIVAVDDKDYKKAKKLLLGHRKRIGNRHNI